MYDLLHNELILVAAGAADGAWRARLVWVISKVTRDLELPIR